MTLTALCSLLALSVGLSSPAMAQSVTATGDVSPPLAPGPQTSWNAAASLQVGVNGSGELRIENGGTVTSTEGSIGHLLGSAGTVAVSGIGSSWKNTVNLDVGWQGAGELTIANGGMVTNESATIGNQAGSSGTATVSGNGALWTNTASLAVGHGGDGALRIENGGVVIDTGGYIGTYLGSTGMVTVSGDGALWANSNILMVGAQGNGELNIENGGTVTSKDQGFIGDMAGSTGRVTVSGTGSSWKNDSDLYVGDFGAGELTVADGGAITNTAGYIGYGAGSSGTATVSGDGALWTNSNSLAIGNQGAGTLTVARGGAISASQITIANDAGSTGILNIGGAAGQAAVDAGKITAGSVQFGGGTGTINFNHTETDYAFAPEIVGNGSINVMSGTTRLTAADSSGFTGHTAVSGGTLLLEGKLGGNASTVGITSGGVLAGNGTVGTTVIASGVTIAPGNSIGTINVAGDITFAAGSRYKVEVDPAGSASDLIHATGKAFLNGGSVMHIGAGGAYTPTSTYTILTADGGVDGAFDAVTSNFAFLDPILGYGAHDVTLTLARNDTTFCSVGLARNQCAAGAGVESLAMGNAVYEALVGLDEATARAAFDQLSGEIHASASTALIEDSHFVREAMSDRVRSAFAGVGASQAGVLAYGPNGQSVAASDTGSIAAWGHAFGSWGESDGDGNAATLKRSTGGLLIGVDGLVAENWRLGLMAGYSHSSFDADDRASSGSSDNYHLGLYGGTQWDKLAFRSGVAYTWHDIETGRSVGFGGFSDRLNADYNAGAFQAFGELGYRIDTAGISIEPFANLAHVRLHTEAFAERGGAAALSVNGSTTDTTFTTLGLRASSDFTLGAVNATARGMLGWKHAFGDTTPLSTHAFAGGNAFTIAGVSIAQDSAVVEVGFDLNLTDTATLGISYNGQFATGLREHGLKAQLGVKF